MRGRLNSSLSKNIFLRLAQYDRWRDKEYKLKICRTIIRAKIRNMRFVLQRYMRNHPEADFKPALSTLERNIKLLESKEEIQGIMGVEGYSSGIYFSCFTKMFRSEMHFKVREKNPSPDPVNAMLSLGYVMVTNEIASLLEGMSLDPFLGFLHGIKYGRKSLALDMVEEFRQPLVDQFTLSLANLRVFSENDFEIIPGSGAYLKNEPFKRYLSRYEARLKEETDSDSGGKLTWRDHFRRQMQRLENSIMDGADYIPFIAR